MERGGLGLAGGQMTLADAFGGKGLLVGLMHLTGKAQGIAEVGQSRGVVAGGGNNRRLSAHGTAFVPARSDPPEQHQRLFEGGETTTVVAPGTAGAAPAASAVLQGGQHVGALGAQPVLDVGARPGQ